MSKVQFSNCPKIIPVQKDSTTGEEKECNQQLCNSEGACVVLETQNAVTETVNSSISIVPPESEKMLPFNKRKSQYYIWREGDSALPSALPTPEEPTYPGNEVKRAVKMRSLKSIYERTKPITNAERTKPIANAE